MHPRTLFSKQHRLAYVVISAFIGFTCAVVFEMRSNGIAFAPVAGRPLELAMVWLAGVFIVDLIWRTNTKTSNNRSARAAGWSGICFGIIVVSWILVSGVLPNSAGIHLTLRREYINAHWQVDPVTKLTYFPLDFYEANESGKTVIPGHFFLLDRENRLSVDPNSHVVKSPSCPGAIYTAYRLEDQIYFLRHYTMTATAPVFPCLVTPIPKGAWLEIPGSRFASPGMTPARQLSTLRLERAVRKG